MTRMPPIPEYWDLSRHPERVDEVIEAVESCPDRGPPVAPGRHLCLAGKGRPPTPGLACGPCCTACAVARIDAARGRAASIAQVANPPAGDGR